MEIYQLNLSNNVKSLKELFAIYTDNIFLGESGIERWNAFYDLLYLRLMNNDINLVINHDRHFFLDQEDMEYYKSVLKDMEIEFPEKISFNFS